MLCGALTLTIFFAFITFAIHRIRRDPETALEHVNTQLTLCYLEYGLGFVSFICGIIFFMAGLKIYETNQILDNPLAFPLELS